MSVLKSMSGISKLAGFFFQMRYEVFFGFAQLIHRKCFVLLVFGMRLVP